MSISSERFEFALKNLRPEEWARFEALASSFLASELPNLRTRASTSGDGGRDAELFVENVKPNVAIQYSVRTDWTAKIQETRRRVEQTAPQTTLLIYVTNQKIGADADDVKSTLLDKGISLDTRDRSWFIERLNTNSARAESAAEFCRAVVDPLLEHDGVVERRKSDLTPTEAKSALLFLEMQILDGQREYGWTKASFDSLVRAALSGTSTEKRMGRSRIKEAVSSFLPAHSPERLSAQVDAALVRLQRGPIKRRAEGDEFHLRDEEIERLRDSASEIKLLRSELDDELRSDISSDKALLPKEIEDIIQLARRSIESYLMTKGDQFVRAVTDDKVTYVEGNDLHDAVLAHFADFSGRLSATKISTVETLALSMLSSPGPKTAKYLSILSDSYTLFSFLQSTPDVQKVTQKMFGQADLWLDTSIVLPLLAEIADPESDRIITKICQDAKSLGMKLYITSGVVEELERHINKCRVFINIPSWKGKTPYLYSRYAFAGRSDATFSSWLENFAGNIDPEEDISDYLRTKHGIEVSRTEALEDISEDLKNYVNEAWRAKHSRSGGDGEFDMASNRLALHDADNYLNIIQCRHSQYGRSPLGYSTWWVTLHAGARDIFLNMPHELKKEVKGSPILSVDFLVRYLAMGPRREQITPTAAAPRVLYAGDILESLPMEMIAAARQIRQRHAHLEEFAIRRKIREELKVERTRLGSLDAGGLDGFSDLASRIY